jgi:hypothetical protein
VAVNVEALDRIWKGKAWSDGARVTRIPQSDGSYSEGVGALMYGWDATSGAFGKVPVDHSTGALNVAVVGGGGTGGGLAQTQVRNASNVWTDVGFAGGNQAMPVNVVAGGAGGGLSQLQVESSTPGTWTNVGYAAGDQTLPVGGNVASGAADSGNPLKIGGAISTATPGAGTTGNRVNEWFGANGQVMVGFGTGGATDALANNPQVPLDSAGTSRGLAIMPYLYNGATYDRARGDLTNGLFVNLKASSATVSVSGTVTANQGGSNWSMNQAQVAGTTTDTNAGNASAGTQRVVLATNQPTVATTSLPAATDGASVARLASSAASTNATNVKGSGGCVYGVHFLNTNAAVRYVHLYNKATSPTVGTDTPLITLPCPPNNGGIVRTFVEGALFNLGIGYAITTDAAATASAVASGDIVGLAIDYA